MRKHRSVFIFTREEMKSGHEEIRRNQINASDRVNCASHDHRAMHGHGSKLRAHTADNPNVRPPRTSRHSKPIRHRSKYIPTRAKR